ncbi:hypothetical protein [Laspinema olomoucense]|uniref:hypothetical protein n=1 Tax=Laspinema olomoucense TaxID=3231600 RepID=UPI0021BB3C37|nr:hypothetical protein [Laspinema sp. D3c]MCT7994090.1 hypothetical protein [Laspinema sp. D3c]
MVNHHIFITQEVDMVNHHIFITQEVDMVNNDNRTEQIVIPSPKQSEGRTLLDYDDSPVAIILAIAILIKALLPVMMERSEKGGK